MRLLRFPIFALGAVLAAACIQAMPAHADDDQLGPKPAMCGIGCWGAAGTTLDESRLGYFTLDPTVVHVGQKVTAHWIKLGDPSFDSSWAWPWKGKGCAKKNSATCVFKATAATGGWSVVTIGIGNPIGAADSQNAYAVLDDSTAVIDGYVNNKTGGGVGGVSIELTGTKRYGATTGADGFYSVVVKPGHYAVIPSGGPGKNPTYRPKSDSVAVSKGQTVGADFELQSALDVQLKLDSSSVPADGEHVVKGTLTVTDNGKPDPNQAISLEAQPNSESINVAHGTLCSGTSRIWPQGSITEPNLSNATITTDAKGKYTFTIQVGTVPGKFTVQAWAQDGFGQDITEDTTAARDTATLDETSIGSHGAASLIEQLNAMHGTSATANAPGDPYGIYQLLTKLTTDGSPLGGIAYGYMASNFGSSILIYDAASPPKLTKNGNVAASSSSFVFDMFWWTGALGINDAITSGQLVAPLPTFAQWTNGRTAGLWKMQDGVTPPGKGTPGTGSFEGFGYGYPNPAGCE